MGHQTELRLPPRNIDAEKAVLGAMLINYEAIGTAIEHLDGFCFYETGHQKIFEAIKTSVLEFAAPSDDISIVVIKRT